MRRTLLVFLAALLFIPSVAGAAVITDEAPFDASELPRIRQAMLRVVNRERLRHELPALTYSPLLEQSAQAHAEDMLDRFYISHRNPEGQNSADRIRQTGYLSAPCQCAWKYWTGENVAWGQRTIREVMKDWMNSQEHRSMILSSNFTDIGIGIEDIFWVQNFGAVVQTAFRGPRRFARNTPALHPN